MKLRRLLTAGAAAACAAAGLAAQAGSASATTVDGTPLRTLGEPIGLRVGTAAIPFDLDTPAYAKITGEQFSVVTPGNEMKWETVEPTQGTYDWSKGDKLVAFAQAHGQLVRGHTLLWENQFPSWLQTGVKNGSITNGELRALLKKHITDEVTHFKGKIWQWDVANEFMANSWDASIPNSGGIKSNFWTQHLGTGIIADAFRWAHAADPNALLFYNDYNITGEDGNNNKFTAAYNFVKGLKAHAVPINGVGEQGHLDTQYGFNATKFQQDLKSFADLGLKVAVTEADVRTFVDSPATQVPTDPTKVAVQQADWKGLIDGCLSLKACISFTAWGFGDTDSWVPYTFAGEGAAGLYDVNLNPKATYVTVQQELQAAANTAPKR